MADLKTPFSDSAAPKPSGQPSGSVEVNGEKGLPGRTGGKLAEVVRVNIK